MLPITAVRAVYVALHRVDFRKSFDGLLAECYHLGLDPLAGDLVLFVGRSKRLVKILFADSTGLWILSKRFSERTMRTRLRFLSEPKVQTITQGELAMFCEGSAYQLHQRLLGARPLS